MARCMLPFVLLHSSRESCRPEEGELDSGWRSHAPFGARIWELCSNATQIPCRRGFLYVTVVQFRGQGRTVNVLVRPDSHIVFVFGVAVRDSAHGRAHTTVGSVDNPTVVGCAGGFRETVSRQGQAGLVLASRADPPRRRCMAIDRTRFLARNLWPQQLR